MDVLNTLTVDTEIEIEELEERLDIENAKNTNYNTLLNTLNEQLYWLEGGAKA